MSGPVWYERRKSNTLFYFFYVKSQRDVCLSCLILQKCKCEYLFTSIINIFVLKTFKYNDGEFLKTMNQSNKTFTYTLKISPTQIIGQHTQLLTTCTGMKAMCVFESFQHEENKFKCRCCRFMVE